MATILVVDDEPMIRELLALTVGPEYEIEEATDGVEALDRLRRCRPDLVLLDVAMPRVDGLAVCRAARAEPALGRLRIITLSAYARRDEALAAGADRHFEKPFRPLELLGAIDELLALRGPGAALTPPGRAFPSTEERPGAP